MISFFPKPYPDELFYSVIARYFVRSGSNQPTVTIKELFGAIRAASIDLPCSFGRLIERLPTGTDYTSEGFIYNNTLYNFYSPFLGPEKAMRVKDLMIGDDGKGIHPMCGGNSDIHLRSEFLRFCPECLRKDKKTYGEIYWHRVHQIPGVLVCPEHRIQLLDSFVPVTRHNKFEYIAASEENCKLTKPKKRITTYSLDRLVEFAEDCGWLLANRLDSKPSSWFQEKYSEILKQKGIASCTGINDLQKLHDELIAYYGSRTFSLWNFNFTRIKSLNLFTKFKAFRHLLLIRFLAGGAGKFFESQHSKYEPFGKPAWPCLNPACEDYLQPVIKEVKITCCLNKHGKPMGKFSCNRCGFKYARRGPDQSENDRIRVSSVFEIGDRLREVVLDCCEDKRTNELSPKIIVEAFGKLGYEPFWLKNKKPQSIIKISTAHKKKSEIIKIEKRQMWVNLISKNPNAIREELKTLNTQLYFWLLRHDKEWYKANSPISRTGIHARKGKDWNALDAETLARVSPIVRELLESHSRPKRITLWRVGRIAGIWTFLDKNLDKMPETNAYLQRVLETTENYNIRKIRWAAEYINQQGKQMFRSSILQVAGISRLSAAIEKEIERQMHSQQIHM
ncbi:hypothetical protein SDC9_45765 [bioreactor metagenome]|uniref:Uncharacterized protein n=1 Tax=bioreactor metagenome TaxID=1076179 RepID=A0A644W7L9_9ZZZZ|nr:TnsD family Tn7-like transposition protein [Desulfitobacterium hafniense]MEA5025894.1 TnsD family Tn7-like transposition protein [Desulfitobacterium hafniense]